jgi:glycosyltransferase involved in cell wall biosynthesis
MKILYLASEPGIFYEMSGGAGTHMRGTVEPLIDKGHEVGVFIGGDYLSNTNNKVNAEKKKGSLLRCFFKMITPSEFKKIFNDIKRLRVKRDLSNGLEDFLNDFGKPEIVYERSAFGLDIGLQISKKYNIPYCLESDVTLLEIIRPYTSYIFNRFIYKKIESRKISQADGITVMSEASIPLLKNLWNIKHDRIFFKGLGIDAKKINSKEDNVVNELFNLEDKIVVGYIGIFQDYQNIPILFDVAEQLKANPNVVILIVGTGKRIDEYKKEINCRKLDNIIFTGLIDKSMIDSYYSRIDIGVITDNASHMYPVKYLEFLAYKKPTLFPAYDAFRTFFENSDNFDLLSFTPGNPISLKDKILRIITERDRVKEITLKLSSVVQNKYSWHSSADRLISSLRQTLDYKKSK